MVGGAYVLSGPSSFFGIQRVGAESTEELLKAYAAKDTDADGLPDWQESLYGTDPHVADTDGDGTTDGEAVRTGLIKPRIATAVPAPTPIDVDDIPGPTAQPGSVTDQFGQLFLDRYVKAGGGSELTVEQQQALVDDLLIEFGTRAEEILDSNYSEISVRVSPTVTVDEYAAAVELTLRSHETTAEASNPILLMEAYLQNGDQSALPHLRTLEAAYYGIAKDLAGMTVPTSLREEHLTLMRSFDSLGRSTTAVINFEKDPLVVMGSLAVYPQSSRDMLNAFQDIAAVILENGEPASGTPGVLIVATARAAQEQGL
jgi:hypothetical protein